MKVHNLTAIKVDLSKHGSIPKTIYVSWKTKDILENQSPVILNGVANLKLLNPDYILEISDDNDIETYLKEHLKTWDYIKIKNKKIVEKVDLWRLLKIYNEGGIYVDIDRYCNISFDDIIEKNTKCILPTYADIDFSQDIMISCKNNPIFKKVIDRNLKKRMLLNPRGVFHLGHPLYMRSVTEAVFGKSYKRKPSSEVMKKFRELLTETKHFQTYKEILPHDSLIYKHDEVTFKKGDGLNKDDFYKSQNIKSWSSGYDTNTLILLAIFIPIIIILLIIKLAF
jgi:mannosyltransferase OCH1-like enzyme